MYKFICLPGLHIDELAVLETSFVNSARHSDVRSGQADFLERDLKNARQDCIQVQQEKAVLMVRVLFHKVALK